MDSEQVVEANPVRHLHLFAISIKLVYESLCKTEASGLSCPPEKIILISYRHGVRSTPIGKA